MCKLLTNPNLPQKKVNKVIISSRCGDTEKSLNKLGIECIKIYDRTNVCKGIFDHPDVHFCQADDRTVFVSSVQKHLIDDLKSIGDISVNIEKNVNDGFPDETLLNCVFFGNNVIYNNKTVSTLIKDFIDRSKLNKIVVSQGYKKCSVAVVLNSVIITDDLVISKKVIEQGIDCLLVKKGQVKLKGYDYGFIGGCCGKVDNNVIAFNGELKYHSDYRNIVSFLRNYNIETVDLKKGELEDIGSIIPLFE